MTLDVRAHFSRFRAGRPGWLHFAAHSHHWWPDVTFEAQQQAWLDAAAQADDKWDGVFGQVWPEAQRHVARELGLANGAQVVFAGNTHELLLRLLSCLPERPVIVASDAEFHSFERQTKRLEEEQLLTVHRVPSEPFATFGERLVTAARRYQPQLTFFSHVFFNSGAVVPHLEAVVDSLPKDTWVCVDGYHGFCAVPTNWAPLSRRAFYLSGGYKYAMAGEGACFLVVPEGLEARPRNTGWFAAFGALSQQVPGQVPYASGGSAFLGATFDPSALYRFNAVMRWRAEVGLTAEKTRTHAHALQSQFISGLVGELGQIPLVVPLSAADRGQFLTFRTTDAGHWQQRLHQAKVVTDARGDRLRFGFGVYQSAHEVDALRERLLEVSR
jgi:kynureninase